MYELCILYHSSSRMHNTSQQYAYTPLQYAYYDTVCICIRATTMHIMHTRVCILQLVLSTNQQYYEYYAQYAYQLVVLEQEYAYSRLQYLLEYAYLLLCILILLHILQLVQQYYINVYVLPLVVLICMHIYSMHTLVHTMHSTSSYSSVSYAYYQLVVCIISIVCTH